MKRTALISTLLTRPLSIIFVVWLLGVSGCTTLVSSSATNADASLANNTRGDHMNLTIENTPPSRKLVLCLDGTWNGAYDKIRREDGASVLKPTNVLKVCRAILPQDSEGIDQVVFYNQGVGSLAAYPGASNWVLAKVDNYFGGAWGAGFEANLEEALSDLTMNYIEGDGVYVFGFSRGAATARGLTQFIEWAGGLPQKRDAYYLPILFREFLASKGASNVRKVIADINQEKQKLGPLRPIDIRYLGVWDTVMALGGRFRATKRSTTEKTRSFYVQNKPSRFVRHARQALAIDERRWDFRPEIWTKAYPHQKLEQRWFVGAHSNVGGGYPNDGLANITLAWILKGAHEEGLSIDNDFIAHYRMYPQDRLYNSYSVKYRVLDTLRLRLNGGVRMLMENSPGANLRLDKSVIERMLTDPQDKNQDGSNKYPEMKGKWYRPENVLDFLGCIDDLDGYLEEIGSQYTTADFPDDIKSRIRKGCSGPF
jgi:uncharacterized protein (DUF2235 family)